ncbi:hypothetical protein [Myxococcus landrumensis]|uniref:Lipoprotein n=1 Tax=Myxococcus landrumensis TaxID=2813577 RepID=A0ABX7MY86_9BACT|nr:hypothetical protein [Myxococcus landrumus]QSQ11256.1 hypothetical protein JY572_22850 [Myxococcus landrumus]
MNVVAARFPWMLSLLFSLSSLAPGRVLAASEVPSEEILPSPSRNTSPEEPAPESRSAALEALHTSARILVELGAMSATSLSLALPGYFVGNGSCQNHSGIGACLDEAAAGALVGAAVGAPIGVMWGARLLGGKGTWGGTLLGAGVGAGTGTVTSLLFVKKGDFLIVYTAALAGSILGSLVGYEVSHSIHSRPPDPTEVHVQPLVAVGQGGMTLGLGGSF